jgi:predicted nucleic acid-binding protein
MQSRTRCQRTFGQLLSVWIALAFDSHPLHATAEAAFLAASPAQPALFCRATQLSVLRLLTTAVIAKRFGVAAATNHQALAIIDGFMAPHSVAFVDEPANVFSRWRMLAFLPTASPKRWMDAYLAAFAIEAGLGFVTGDKDFAAFPGLNPTILVVPAPPVPASPPAPPSPGQGGGATP